MSHGVIHRGSGKPVQDLTYFMDGLLTSIHSHHISHGAKKKLEQAGLVSTVQQPILYVCGGTLVPFPLSLLPATGSERVRSCARSLSLTVQYNADYQPVGLFFFALSLSLHGNLRVQRIERLLHSLSQREKRRLAEAGKGTHTFAFFRAFASALFCCNSEHAGGGNKN